MKPALQIRVRLADLSRMLLTVIPLYCLSSLSGAGTQDAMPLVERYCFDCHADGLKKGGISFDKLLEGPGNDAPEWKKIWKITRHEMMPPADEDQPSPEERETITRWLEAEKLGVDHSNPDPGRVTMRRLNRTEYQNTVTDIFGQNITTEKTFSADGGVITESLRDLIPPDDQAFGFENNGDFQNLSPSLLEKYFAIADLIVGELIAFDGPSFPSRELDRGALKIEKPGDSQLTRHSLKFTTDTVGEYEIALNFTLGGWEEYRGAFDFVLSLDGTPIDLREIEVGGQKTHRINPHILLAKGEHELVFTTVPTKPDFNGNLIHHEFRPRIVLTGPMIPGTATYPESHRRIFTKTESPSDPEERAAYAREILRKIADKAFRRPADDHLLERLVTIVSGNESFEHGIGQAISAILSSPKFLYRVELQPQPDDPKTAHPIDDYALASRLSYFLWLSIPDDELNALAASGKLRENLRPQLARMLADPKAGRFFEDFPGQWLRTRNILLTAVSRKGEVINRFRGDLKRETEALFENIARSDADLAELVTGNYSYINANLAEYYGIPGIEGGHFRKVVFEETSHRGGILGNASFLASTSNPDRTSPVKRGLFVLENLLAIEPPPPPPNIPTLDEAKAHGKQPMTVREQLVMHREDKSCASCHAHFDPIGLALENYDAVGRWRDDENGTPIRPDETTTTGAHLTGMADLKSYFATRKDRFYHCVTEKLLTYALGRGLEPADAVTVDDITRQLMEDGGKFSTLLTAIVESPAFLTRRGDDGAIQEPTRSNLPAIPPPDKRKGKKFSREQIEAFQRRQKELANP